MPNIHKIRIDYLKHRGEVGHIFTDTVNVGLEIATILDEGATDIFIYKL